MPRRLFSFILLMLLATGVALHVRINSVRASPQAVDPGYAVEMFATGLDGPFGMAFDDEGNLYVTNEGSGGEGGTITEVAPDGQRVSSPVDSLAQQG